MRRPLTVTSFCLLAVTLLGAQSPEPKPTEKRLTFPVTTRHVQVSVLPDA